jgi:hypothetical protein
MNATSSSSAQRPRRPGTLFRLLQCAALCLGLGLGGTALAAPASAASVEKLIAINGAQKSLEQAVGGIEAHVRQQIVSNLVQQNGGAPLTPQQQAAVDKMVPGLGVVLRQEMSWARLKVPYIELYQAQLNQAEVDRLIELYEDPAYVVLMQKMQVVNGQSARLVQQQLPSILQRVQPVIANAMKDVLNR